MKFAHLGDCHLGGWSHPELKELNMRSFQEAISRCIRERVEFVLIAGDLFDTSYPSIETLKGVFDELRKLKEANVPVFLIAGSHDFSAAGKSFLDVIEKGGLCKNVGVYEERDEKIVLHPTLLKNVAIYGYPGKKSALEVDDIERIKLDDSPGFFKILMLHTSLKDAVGTLPIKAVEHRTLPKVDYLALGHLHVNYNRENRVYSGPIFPNNISELEELKHGFFYIFENGKARKEELKLKDVLVIDLEIKDSLGATDKILARLQAESVENKVIILKLHGVLEKGKISDIGFQKIDSYLKVKRACTFLRSTTKLHMAEPEVKLEALESANLEGEIVKRFEEQNPSKFNSLIPLLMKTLQFDKQEDEKKSSFEERVILEAKKILSI